MISRACFQPHLCCGSVITAFLARTYIHPLPSSPCAMTSQLFCPLYYCTFSIEKNPDWNWLFKCFKETFYFYVKEKNLANACDIFERKVWNNQLQNGILYRLTKQPASNGLICAFPTRWEQKHHYQWMHVKLNEKKTRSRELCSDVIYPHRVKKFYLLVYYMYLIDTLQWSKSGIPLAKHSIQFSF